MRGFLNASRFLFFYFMCIGVLPAYMSVCHTCELWTVVSWESNIVFLEERSVLLTTEPSLQPLKLRSFCFCFCFKQEHEYLTGGSAIVENVSPSPKNQIIMEG